jgi:XTP/dITP diphosphohydrolase
MRLLVATTNPGKKVEFRSLLDSPGFEILFPDDLGIKMDVDETGSTYLENAVLKAETLSKLSNLPTLSDDTGLEVAVLDGRPGLYSARYARKLVSTDAGRRTELLKELAGFPKPWSARFVCVAAVAIPGEATRTFHGDVAGEIISEERGEHGFGYDRIFYISKLGKTMAELDLPEKNLYSHRALAVNQAKEFLTDRQ